MNDHIYLAHHGVKGMKWGVRRFQNPDGSLTTAGKRRYKLGDDGSLVKLTRSERRAYRRDEIAKSNAEAAEERARVKKQAVDDYASGRSQKFGQRLSAINQINDTQRESRREFRRSEEGKVLSKEYDDQVDRMNSLYGIKRQYENAPDSSITKYAVDREIAGAREDFDKAARRIAEAEGRQAYSRLAEKYGEAGVERFMNDSWFSVKRQEGESLVDWYVREQYEMYRFDEDDW